MGYRSEVAIAIKKEVKAWALIANTPLPKLLSEAHTFSGPTAEYYYFDRTKWYIDSPEVNEVMNFLQTLDGEFPEITESDQRDCSTYGFIRVGEELEDVETHGNPWDFNMWAYTGIAEIEAI